MDIKGELEKEVIELKKTITVCLDCGKELPPKKKVGRKSLFCNTHCYHNWRYNTNIETRQRMREASKLAYLKQKDTPEFKSKRRKYFQSWREKNLEKHNKFMRDYMRERAKRLYHERREVGVCTRCGKEKSSGYECDECKSKRRWK